MLAARRAAIIYGAFLYASGAFLYASGAFLYASGAFLYASATFADAAAACPAFTALAPCPIVENVLACHSASAGRQSPGDAASPRLPFSPSEPPMSTPTHTL